MRRIFIIFVGLFLLAIPAMAYFGDGHFGEVVDTSGGSGLASGDAVLLETGDLILLETGDFMLLE